MAKKEKVLEKADVDLHKQVENKRFRFFIWNSTIHNAFIVLLFCCFVLMFAALQVQSAYVGMLKDRIEYYETRSFSEAFEYDYDTIAYEDFANNRGFEVGSIAHMIIYFRDNDFHNVKVQPGFVEAKLSECVPGGCYEKTYRFNQNKGLYVDVFSKKLNE